MEIMDNDLVKKYFGYDNCLGLGGSGKCTHPNCMALRILKSQQQPIRKDDKYLVVMEESGKVYEVYSGTENTNTFHPRFLRLPDAFQKQDKEYLNSAQWQNRAALAENLISKIKKEISERDYGLWGKNLWKLLKEFEDSISAKYVDCGINLSSAENQTKPTPSPEKCAFHCNEVLVSNKCPTHSFDALKRINAVEEKIERMVRAAIWTAKVSEDEARKELRDLVRLARETK